MDVKRYSALKLSGANSDKSTHVVFASDFDRITAERDALQLRLNAVEEENDRMRQDSSENTRKLDALLAHCDDGECMTCGTIICPHGEPLHFHHDGCPACYQFEELEKRP